MLVFRVIGDCPGCGATRAFGNVLVSRNFVLRGCGWCKYEQHYPILDLPPKKILYLDQPFFSAAFRHKQDSKQGQPAIVRLMNRIQDLAAQQLITVPRSSIHEAETRQWDKRKEALAFLKVTSRGHEFELDYKLERRQVLKGFRAWLDGDSPNYSIEQKEALSPRVHDWDGYLIVDVEFDKGDGSEEAERKIRSAENLVNLLDEWRLSTSTFNEDFRGELQAQKKVYGKQHLEWMSDLSAGDMTTLLHLPMVEHMRNCLPSDFGVTAGVAKCAQFFDSEHFANLPIHSITCRTHSRLKHEVRGGLYKVRETALRKLQGYFTDLDHIAHYAPYCDAIALDKPMAELMKKPGVDLEKTYGVKVFSLSTVPAFDAWLDEVEGSMTAEHREALKEIYG